MSDPARLRKARQALVSAVADIGHYPCRLDEMTDREQAIAGMVGMLVGAVQYVLEGPLREEEGMMSDVTKGLPPGPWRVVRARNSPDQIIGFTSPGRPSVIAIDVSGPSILAQDDIIAAIATLPLLVEAARRVVSHAERGKIMSMHTAIDDLACALALVDGEG
jgi:hypothetical protein